MISIYNKKKRENINRGKTYTEESALERDSRHTLSDLIEQEAYVNFDKKELETLYLESQKTVAKLALHSDLEEPQKKDLINLVSYIEDMKRILERRFKYNYEILGYSSAALMRLEHLDLLALAEKEKDS